MFAISSIRNHIVTSGYCKEFFNTVILLSDP